MFFIFLATLNYFVTYLLIRVYIFLDKNNTGWFLDIFHNLSIKKRTIFINLNYNSILSSFVLDNSLFLKIDYMFSVSYFLNKIYIPNISSFVFFKLSNQLYILLWRFNNSFKKLFIWIYLRLNKIFNSLTNKLNYTKWCYFMIYVRKFIFGRLDFSRIQKKKLENNSLF